MTTSCRSHQKRRFRKTDWFSPLKAPLSNWTCQRFAVAPRSPSTSRLSTLMRPCKEEFLDRGSIWNSSGLTPTMAATSPPNAKLRLLRKVQACLPLLQLPQSHLLPSSLSEIWDDLNGVCYMRLLLNCCTIPTMLYIQHIHPKQESYAMLLSSFKFHSSHSLNLQI